MLFCRLVPCPTHVVVTQRVMFSCYLSPGLVLHEIIETSKLCVYR